MENRVILLSLVFFLFLASGITYAAPHTFTIEEIPAGPDTTPPAIVSTDPANNSINHPVTRDIMVTFDEPVIAGMTYGSITVENGTQIAITKSINGNILTLHPSASLSINTQYIVTIPGGALNDSAGNAMAEDHVFGFKTAATTKMYYKHTFTLRNATGNIIPNSKIRLYNSTGNLLPDFSFNISAPTKDIEMDESGYSVRYSIPSGMAMDIKNARITANRTVSPQFIDDYVKPLPNSTAVSPLIALNDTLMQFDYVELTLPVTSAPNAIIHCKSGWSYSMIECSEWEIFLLASYPHTLNQTHIVFNVSAFDAYIAANYTAPVSCSDNTQNGDELGVDCGGSCPACYIPPAVNPSTGGGGGGGGNTVMPESMYSTDAKIVNYPREIRISRNVSDNFNLVVKNTGNRALDKVAIEISSGWFDYDRAKFPLAPGEERKTNVKVVIPESVRPGPYTVRVSLKADSGAGPLDVVSFLLVVANESGASSIAIMDTEAIRQGIDDLNKRIDTYLNQGYDVKSAKGLAESAEGAFRNADYLGAADYLRMGSDALDNAVKQAVKTKTFFGAYAFTGIIVVLLVLLVYYWKKYRAEKAKEEKILEEKLHRVVANERDSDKKQVAQTQTPGNTVKQTANVPAGDDDIRGRLEEIRRKLNEK